MSSSDTISLYTAIINDGGIFLHWSLSAGANHPQRHGLRRSLPLCSVGIEKVGKIKDVAKNIPIKNDVSGWNCQDFVIDLLDELEEDGVLDGENGGIKRRRWFLRGSRRGLYERACGHCGWMLELCLMSDSWFSIAF
ncbi:hypothetical protein K440DRAFT_640905 [Wilcoxina mikolae CBS 423.85]|nr:hypothetical protein K440DRAFT_640905 [Wilcoxina mikolae CBS 423.85]